FLDEVQLEPPAEAAAQVGRVDLHLLRRNAADLGPDALGPRLKLRRGPDIDAVRAHVGGAVHRLHGGVREERQLVHRVYSVRRELQRGLGVAVVARHGARLLGALGEELGDARARDLRVRALVPRHVQRVASLLGRPVPVRYDRYTARDLHYVAHAGHSLRLGRIEALDLPAEHRAARDHGDEHPGDLHVDPELGAAVHLG